MDSDAGVAHFLYMQDERNVKMTRDYIPLPIEPPDDYYDEHEWSDEDYDFGWGDSEAIDPLCYDDIEGRHWRHQKKRKNKQRYSWKGEDFE